MPNWPGEPKFRLMLDGISATEWLKQVDYCYVNEQPNPVTRVFYRPFTHGGRGTSAGGQSINGGGES